MNPSILLMLLFLTSSHDLLAGRDHARRLMPGGRIVTTPDNCSKILLLNRKLGNAFFLGLSSSSNPHSLVPPVLYRSKQSIVRPLIMYLSQFSFVFRQPARSRVVAAVLHRHVGVWSLDGELQMELQGPDQRPLDIVALDACEASGDVAVVRATIDPDRAQGLVVTLYRPEDPSGFHPTWQIGGKVPGQVAVSASNRTFWTFDSELNRLRGYHFDSQLKKVADFQPEQAGTLVQSNGVIRWVPRD